MLRRLATLLEKLVEANCRQSQQGRMEIGLGISNRFSRPKRSGLLTHTATTESVSSHVRMKS